MQMMLDSGSSLSLLRRDSLSNMVGIQQLPEKPMVRLVTAAGTPIQYVQAPVKIGNVEVTQRFLVVDSLIVPVIFGYDFMTKHKVTLDFTTRPVGVHFSGAQIAQHELPKDVQEVWNIRHNEKSKVCAAVIVDSGRKQYSSFQEKRVMTCPHVRIVLLLL